MVINKLTLLVGASGVGKTQILRAIHAMKEIAEGNSLNGVEWNISFETFDKKKYNWTGAFETKDVSIFIEDDDDKENDSNKPKILYEKLLLNDTEEIIDRNADKILFYGNPTIKLSPEKSAINLLKEEDSVKPAFEGLKKIQFSDQSDSVNAPKGFMVGLLNANKLSKKYNTLKKIQESDHDITLKLFWVSKSDKKTFGIIKERFCDIFPQVEDVKVAPLDTRDKDMPDFFKDYPFIQIKELKVDKWIEQSRISSGMFRTLLHISELYLCSEGTVFLIDEFENSLGINCINEITSDILKSRRQLQFILTSHHPYIINSISNNNWKLVTRNAGVIKTHDVAKFNIGKSKHDAFMQLIQLDEYQTGTEQL
ncbi:MAG: AAA family ATPase [Candidatus Auribacterota bacterium]|nr:AAA family ATPase [Candidatus Auribacterota bacterium]